MFEASQMLTKEYVKRACLEDIDRKNFLNFVKPYRKGNAVDFEQIKQDGKLDQYNLLAYLTISSSLGKQLIGNFIKEQSGNIDQEERVKIQKQIERLKGLQVKTIVGTNSGGFIDELVTETGGGQQKSSIQVGNIDIDTTGKSTEEQVELFLNGLQEMLVNEMKKETPMVTGQQIATVCMTVGSKEKAIQEVVHEEAKANTEQKNANYQKTLSQN